MTHISLGDFRLFITFHHPNKDLLKTEEKRCKLMQPVPGKHGHPRVLMFLFVFSRPWCVHIASGRTPTHTYIFSKKKTINNANKKALELTLLMGLHTKKRKTVQGGITSTTRTLGRAIITLGEGRC
mmetsp:Transcript_6957/g.15853  ORF Transcript_6957/g.15853 Transcript_6957/m.15853 type:complete len:126 (+) Transcript_6957:58-435(+)